MKELWTIATSDKNYGTRGHKIFSILEFVHINGAVTYTELNEFSYNYTRRAVNGIPFNKFINRGYIGCNLYPTWNGYSGYIGKYLKKNPETGHYILNNTGVSRLVDYRHKFGYELAEKFNKNA